MKPQNDVLEALGELFIMGLSGFEVASETSAFIQQAQIGGIILFSHNYENPAQLVELSNQIQLRKTHPVSTGIFLVDACSRSTSTRFLITFEYFLAFFRWRRRSPLLLVLRLL